MWRFRHILRVAFVFSCLYSTTCTYVTSKAIGLAKRGEWVSLEGSEDDARIKLVEAVRISRHTFTFSDAENYCKEQRAHLVSLHSKDEGSYLSELVFQVHKRKNKKNPSALIFTGFVQEVKNGKWRDGSSTAYALEMEGKAGKLGGPKPWCFYIELKGNKTPRRDNWSAVSCNKAFKASRSIYIVCKM